MTATDAARAGRSCTGGLAAVLFDMDGTLVATEEMWFEVEYDVMRRLGGPWSDEHQAALVGGPLDASAAYMVELAASEVPAPEVERWLVKTMIRRLHEHGVEWMPGARELLLAVRAAGLPTALVSASYRNLMDAVLAVIGQELFDVTVAGDEVTRGKPDPEPYLIAARRLGADPRCCVVIEDSLTGSAAGLAAGSPTIAVPSVTGVPPAPGLTTVASLTQLRVADLYDLVDAR